MQKLTFLNTREIKRIREIVLKGFGYFPKKDYAYLKNEKDRLFLINKDLGKINLQNLRIDRVGLYFAEIKETEVRLSKEGAQLLFHEAEKDNQQLHNVVELTKEEVKKYFLGEDLEKDLGTEKRLILLKYGDSCLGCAKYKEGKILNFLPKLHRGEVIL